MWFSFSDRVDTDELTLYSVYVEDDLINVVSMGSTWADNFRQECNDNPARFEKTIKRRKIKNFPTYAKKMNIPQKIKRSNYVPLFWRNSTMARLPGVLPT